MITDVSAAACKHLTEKLMRSGVWGRHFDTLSDRATPPTGGLGGSTPQKLGLSDKTESNTPNFRRKFPLKNPKLVDLQK